MIFPELSFEGWVMSHFKWPWEKLAMYDPRTPWEDQETIDYRAEQLMYHNIDLALIGSAMGIHAYYHGWYQATNTIHMYRLANAVRSVSLLANPVVLGAAATLGGAGYIAYKIQTDDAWQSRAQHFGSGLNLSALG